MDTAKRCWTRCVGALTTAFLLASCAETGIRTKTSAFDEICQQRQEITVNDSSGKVERGAQQLIAVDSYAAQAKDIATARTRVAHLRRDYEFYECQMELANRQYFDQPLLATAVAAGAAALAKANPYIVGGVGLVAGTLVAAKSYKHPDTDRDAFMNAYEQLTCIYDKTHPLQFTLTIDKLTYTRDALDAALLKIGQDISEFGDVTNASSHDKAVIAAAKAAQDAGQKERDVVSSTIADYANIATTIYITADAIDIAARRANTTNGSYSSFGDTITSAYKAAGQSNAKAEDAKAQVQSATKPSTSADTAATKDNKTTNQKKNIKALAEPSPAISGPSAFASTCADSSQKDCAQVKIEGTKAIAIDDGTKTELRASQILSDTSTSDTQKLLALATLATEQAPTPTYSEINANIVGCFPQTKAGQ